MARFDKDRKIGVLIEMEKLMNVNMNEIWNYINRDIAISDPEFVRADEFFKYPEMIREMRRELRKEIAKEE